MFTGKTTFAPGQLVAYYSVEYIAYGIVICLFFKYISVCDIFGIF